MKRLLNAKTCPRKAYYAGMSLSSEKGYQYEFKKIVNEVFTNDLTSFDETDLYNKLNAVDDSLFEMKKEKELLIERTIIRVKRVVNTLILERYSVSDKKPEKLLLKTHGKDLSVPIDFYLEKDGLTFACQLTMGKEDISNSLDSPHFVGESERLYGIYLATDKKCIPMLICLQDQKESNSHDSIDPIIDHRNVLEYAQKFLFWHDFAASFDLKASQAFEELANTNISKTSQRCQDPVNCEYCPYRALCLQEDTDNNAEIIEIKKDNTKIEFDDLQKRIIKFHEGEARVLAGPGSGKTTVIASRVKHLIEKRNVDPRRILMITFTKKGVEEMYKKLHAINVDTENIEIQTFNSYGYKILQENYRTLGFTEKPLLIDNDEKLHIIAEILDAKPQVPGLNYYKPYFKMFRAYGCVHKMAQVIDICKRNNVKTMVGFEAAMQNAGITKTTLPYGNPDVQNLCLDIYNTYQKMTIGSNKVEFDDQINFALEIFKKDDALKQEYMHRYDHIIVDEFQDTDEREMELLQILYQAGDEKSLMVVGDDAQGIFGFRNVSIDNIMKFEETYPDTVDLPISLSFRSTQEILDVANNIISHNDLQADKFLVSKKHGPKPQRIIAPTKEVAIFKAAEKVETLLHGKVQPKDIAVICRTRQEILDLRKALNAKNIPNVISVSEYLRDDNQIIAINGLASFMKDDTHILELGVFLKNAFPEEFNSAFDVEGYIVNKGAMIKEEIEPLDDEGRYRWLFAKINECFHESSTPRISWAMQSFLQSEEDKEPSFERVSRYLKQICEQKANIYSETDPRVYNAVYLTTIHSAKGREWENVIVVANGLKKKKTSSKKGTSYSTTYEYNEEEIRAFFVAVTRAQKKLTIIYDQYWQRACSLK